jgi:hypothetical protein
MSLSDVGVRLLNLSSSLAPPTQSVSLIFSHNISKPRPPSTTVHVHSGTSNPRPLHLTVRLACFLISWFKVFPLILIQFFIINFH